MFLEIEGPEGTVYAKGMFHIKIQIPERFCQIILKTWFLIALFNWVFFFSDNCSNFVVVGCATICAAA